jgi:hypothetical protein
MSRAAEVTLDPVGHGRVINSEHDERLLSTPIRRCISRPFCMAGQVDPLLQVQARAHTLPSIQLSSGRARHQERVSQHSSQHRLTLSL